MAFTYRIADGPRAGQKVFTLQGAMPRGAALTRTLCADVQGLGLHAAVRRDAHERQPLAQLCRYITCPVLADERVQCNAAGQAVLKLKSAWRDSTTRVVIRPPEFTQRRRRWCRGALALLDVRFEVLNLASQTPALGRYRELSIVQCRASFDWRARCAHAAARDGVVRAR